MKALKRAAGIFISIVLWAVILLAALFAFTTLATKDSSHVANLAGFTPLNVVSDSMAPTFQAGDLILIRSCDPASLKEGDIVTFHTIINNEFALNTHRITEIQGQADARSYVTKGDNNDIADIHMITDGDIVGKFVARLPHFGRVVEFLSSSMGFLLVIVLPLLIFFVYQVYHLVTVSIDLKKALAVESIQQGGQAEDMLAAAAKAKEEAEKTKAEAEAALAEAKRLQEEAQRHSQAADTAHQEVNK